MGLENEDETDCKMDTPNFAPEDVERRRSSSTLGNNAFLMEIRRRWVESIENSNKRELARSAAPSNTTVNATTPASTRSDSAVMPTDEAEIPSEFECPLCFRLFHEPVSLPCGHSYCRLCLKRALSAKQNCPVCRSPQLQSASDAAANLAMTNLIKRLYPTLYIEREKETALDAIVFAQSKRLSRLVGEETNIDQNGYIHMPIFLLKQPLCFPGTPITLFIFQSRYITMVTRCLSGTKRFVMQGTENVGEVGAILEIEDARMLNGGQYLIQARSMTRCTLMTPLVVETGTHGLAYAHVLPLEDTDDNVGATRVEDVLPPAIVATANRAAEVISIAMEALPARQRQEVRRLYGDAPPFFASLLPRGGGVLPAPGVDPAAAAVPPVPTHMRPVVATLSQYRRMSFFVPNCINIDEAHGGQQRRITLFRSRSLAQRLFEACEIVLAHDAASPDPRIAARGRLRLFKLGSRRGYFLSNATTSAAFLVAIFAGLLAWTLMFGSFIPIHFDIRGSH